MKSVAGVVVRRLIYKYVEITVILIERYGICLKILKYIKGTVHPITLHEGQEGK
jgi:hypothetical protein